LLGLPEQISNYMKKIFFLLCIVFGANKICVAQGCDPNSKHQACSKHDTASGFNTFSEVRAGGHDANYKHQAGRKQKSKQPSLTIPSQGKPDANYKHQFYSH
jgi:hypothetical protein